MRIQRVESSNYFTSSVSGENKSKKREIIDVIVDNVKNPRDVNDCVAVPRGIFKAYIALMAGTGLMGIANCLPAKVKGIKTALNIVGGGLNILSAYYFAKPFAVKGLSPTITKDELKQPKEEVVKND